ncbi:MAG: hypothetical protein LKE51_05840 [Selenomonas sp.]|jgi:hypothetical protein|nr:hypothetical protein [Selenomonas sp.]
MQIETQTYWDTDHWRQERSDDGVYSRLAYINYKPDAKTSFLGGKNAYWFAGGFLGDDFISGVSASHQFDSRTAASMTYGYYNGSQKAKDEDKMHSIITYGEVTSKLGKVNVGAHYLTGTKGLADQTHHSRIWAVTAGTDLGRSGVNLSGGYGQNTAEDDNNKMLKVQLYKKVGLTDTFLQYWKQQAKVNLPMENGNHLTWWGDEYNTDGHFSHVFSILINSSFIQKRSAYLRAGFFLCCKAVNGTLFHF